MRKCVGTTLLLRHLTLGSPVPTKRGAAVTVLGTVASIESLHNSFYDEN
jgi:hypothetical protein